MKKSCFIGPIFALILSLFFSVSQAQSNFNCADTSYRIRFSSPGKDFSFYTHCNTADGGTVMIGRLIDTAANTSELVLLKLSATGGIAWKTKYQMPVNTLWYFSRIIEQQNGEIAASGYVVDGDNYRVMLVKWGANGTLLWSRNYFTGNHFDKDDELHPYFLSEGLNNDLLFSFKGEHTDLVDGLSDSTYAIITRISNNGNVVWGKAFTGTENFATHPSGVYEHNGEVYALGYSDNLSANCRIAGMPTSLYAMRLDYQTGDLLQLKTYCHGGGTPGGIGIWFQQFGVLERDEFNSVKLLNNQFALFGNFSPFDEKRYLYKILLDDQLSIVQAQQYAVPASLGRRVWMKVLPDGTTHLSTIGGRSRSIYWSMLSSSNSVIRERKLGFSNGDTAAGSYLNFGYRNSETYNFSTNYRYYGQRYALFTQLQRNDPTIDSCLGTDTSFVATAPISYSANSWTWRSTVDNAVVSLPFTLISSSFTINTESLCTQISRCDSLRISGPDTLCVTNNFVSFTGMKNPDCHKRILWEVDGALIDSSYQPNDSTFNIRFKQPAQDVQTLTLFASAANCTIAKDTAHVVLFPGVKPLPHDTVVCEPFAVRLSPGKWGKHYRWQNGSTDSVLMATVPGQYSVQVETYCGTIFNDTINISVSHLSLGADRIKCNNDTIVLRATPGFVSYQWWPQQNIRNVADSVVKVFPTDTTQYIVSAQTTTGCLLHDTVTINVLHSPPIRLGSDTTFCEGDSIKLQAPASFNSYQWSNGSASAVLTVKTSGTYWVKAIDSNSCSSTDSITIFPLYPEPVVSIMPKDVVCIGQTDTLKVAGNFALYQWSNGSGNNYLPITSTGTYWIKVVDNNGCAGSNTAKITKMASPPKAFLANDTTVCSGTTIELKSTQSFNRYWWSNGSSFPSIDVSAAGLYVLQVKDNNNCSGIDSIVVMQTYCPNKILFASAFTPNGDGRNDVFKPFVQGQLLEYRFTIYNRWGQIVFSSGDYRKGWDGRLSNMLPETGSFAWLCQYHFAGEGKKVIKGTVTLIR